jgi:hypothetical protein
VRNPRQWPRPPTRPGTPLRLFTLDRGRERRDESPAWLVRRGYLRPGTAGLRHVRPEKILKDYRWWHHHVVLHELGWTLTVRPGGTSQVKSPGGKIIRSRSPPPVPGYSAPPGRSASNQPPRSATVCDGSHVDLVALGIGQGPPHRRVLIADQAASGGQSRPDPIGPIRAGLPHQGCACSASRHAAADHPDLRALLASTREPGTTTPLRGDRRGRTRRLGGG